MAKIVEVTNPVTGQPAQVDQLDHTAQQIDDGLNIARGVSNPNLLDNWYFGNPVDQLGGYVTTNDTPAYSDEGLSTLVGPAYAIYKVKKLTSTLASFVNVDGLTFYCALSDCTRGYTGTGYWIDRWLNSYNPNNFAVLITDNGLATSGSAIDGPFMMQRFERDFGGKLSGKTVTFSVLTTNGLYSGTAIFPVENASDVGVFDSTDTYMYFQWSSNSANLPCAVFAMRNADIKYIAAKLELGSQQTLAHQDENGNWVPNEIPNYADMLERCQYYSDLPTTWAPMTFYVADFIVFTVKTHREMRVNLSSANVTLDSSKLEVHSNGEAQSGFTFSVYGGGDDFILVKAAKSGHGLSNAMLIVNNGGIYANANM